jgi:hypothetical protein
MMKARNYIATLATIVAASFASLGTQAAIVNPDNDSATFFAYRPAVQSALAIASQPRAGDVSPDGLYVYSASDRGWVNRPHTFVVEAGGLAHAADCMPYNAPKPVAAIVPPSQSGAFGDHGA